MRSKGSLLLLLVAAQAALWAPVPRARADGLDLHAHLFFYDGTGLPFFDGFAGRVSVDDWSERIGSKVNAGSLEVSGASIVVVSLYAHPLFLVSQRESVRRQIAVAEEFLRSHSAWGLARSAAQARALLKSGRKALVLSLEGASGILESEADLKAFIDDQGISIVTPMHFTDDEFGGVAFMPGLAVLASPIAWIRSLFSPVRDSGGVRINPNGLTKRGEWLIGALVKRGVWIDYAHASDATQAAIRKLSSQPLLYTHTMLRKYYRAERGISSGQLKLVTERGGMIGLLPSEDMLRGTEVSAELCAPACPWCEGGVPALLQQFSEIAHVVGPASLALGSDINAPLQLIKPECGGRLGFNEYSDLARLWEVLRTRARYRSGEALERFLSLWAKVRP